MRMHLKALVLLPLAFSAYSQTTGRPKSTLSSLDDKARLSQSSDISSVGDLTSAVINRSIFQGSSAGIRNRLTQAQFDYYSGRQKPISDGKLADAINELGFTLQFPGFTSTSTHQIHVLRTLMIPVLPTLFGGSVGEGPATEGNRDLSPLGAWALSSLLLEQKLINPDFQQDPEAWARKTTDRLAHPQQQPSTGPNLVVTTASPAIPAAHKFLQNVNSQLSQDDDPAATRVTAFLDRIGVEK